MQLQNALTLAESDIFVLFARMLLLVSSQPILPLPIYSRSALFTRFPAIYFHSTFTLSLRPFAVLQINIYTCTPEPINHRPPHLQRSHGWIFTPLKVHYFAPRGTAPVPRPLHSTFPLTPLPLPARPSCNFPTHTRSSVTETESTKL